MTHLAQHHVLASELPSLPGWDLAAYYRPARKVCGNFYEFMTLAQGHVGIAIADVTGKGMETMLALAAARNLLRASSQHVLSPGQVLERVNEQLCPTLPSRTRVTCLYAVLDPASGRLLCASAGHDTPYVRTGGGGVFVTRGRGEPLGVMEGTAYQDAELSLSPGDHVLFHNHGLVPTHKPHGQMDRVTALVTDHWGTSAELLARVVAELERFNTPDWHDERQVTLVMLQRAPRAVSSPTLAPDTQRGTMLLTSFTLASRPGNERQAIERVVEAVHVLALTPARVERLKTAIGEATMNAIEHGNQNCQHLLVAIEVGVADGRLFVRITDQGKGGPIPEPKTPSLEAKLNGLQTARGWGLYLMKSMVDELRVTADELHHTVELIVDLEVEGRTS